MKTQYLLTTTLLCFIIRDCSSYIFLDTPEGLVKEREFQIEINKLWDQYTDEESEVIIDAPSLGNNVTVEGKKLILNFTPREILAFKGIKFADAARFQIPVKIDNYADSTVIDATRIGPSCPQSDEDTLFQDEECQYLNVYTPYYPEELTEPLPVMVFIYGGSFTSGSSSYYLPNVLLQHDVILVTINYRLGALGFFTINTPEAPGNYALYDQREALRWVRDHITDFGGNNTCITVFGESAGSCSTSYMTIVADTNSVHRAISESGTFSDVWSVDRDPEYAANYVANEVGCLCNGNINMTCMREADAFDLTAAEKDLVSEDRKNGLLGFRGCAPTIQADWMNDTLITKMPQLYYEEGDFNKIPYMIGTNKDEGSLITSITERSYLSKNCLTDDYCLIDNEEYLREQMITDMLHSFGVEDPSHALSNSLILEYCEGIDLGDYYTAAPCLIDMFGVLFLKAGGWKVANLHSMFSGEETYHYSFDYDDGIIGFVYDENYDVGVTHAEELKYIFTPVPRLTSSINQKVSDRMTTLWTNFAKYGNPTPPEEINWQDLEIPEFTPYHFEDHHYMLMRSDFIMQTEFPLRWTIRYDEEAAGEELTMEPPSDAEEPAGETVGKDFIEAPKKEVKSFEEPPEDEVPGISSKVKSDEDVEDMEKKRDAYMITMIVFIVAFCITIGIAIYFYMLTKKR